MLSALMFQAVVFAAIGDIEQARALYQSTRYQEALRTLKDNAEVEAIQLQGQCWYMLEDFKKAAGYFERALDARPANSNLHLWLGRAYGRRAETSNPLFAPRYATRARDRFEKAVELDPRNILAMNDLFEYYMQAPGFLGGGKDKAAKLADRIAQLDAAEGHFVRARMAEDVRDDPAAERHYRAAIEATREPLGRIIDLARFLARRARFNESDAEFDRARKLSPNHPKLIYEQAAALIESRRNLPQARALLQKYIQMPRTPDDPSRAEAEKLLRDAGS